MENLTPIASAAADEIYNIVDDKLQPQYRVGESDSYRFKSSGKKAKLELHKLFVESIEKTFDIVIPKLKMQVREDLVNDYKSYIPKPLGTTGQRWRFLFTGKLN